MPSTSTYQIVTTKQLRFCKMEKRNDSIIQYTFDNDITIDVDDIHALVDALAELTQGVKHGMLVISGDRNSTTKEAIMESMKKLKSENYAFAEAIVITSLPTRIAANFFYKIYSPVHPYKTFKDIDSAEKWLKSFLN